MQNNGNKESFKLLQLSDTSKSSELELPEVNVQRKRRIRRKTRSSASPHLRNNNLSNSIDDSQSPCNNVGLWTAMFMSCGWLLILSYMMAVVYTENRRLEVEISKLSTSNQGVPDALQKWHETSKFLEQNQTSIFNRLADAQKQIDNFEKELTNFKNDLNKKDENSEQEKIKLLEKSVATFGANIVSLKDEVEILKNKTKINDDEMKTELIKLHESINSTKIIVPTYNNDTMNALTNVTNYVNNQLTSFSLDLTKSNKTLTEKTKQLEDDIIQNKKKFDEISDNVANVTAQVQSIELSLSQSKTTGTTVTDKDNKNSNQSHS